MVYKDKDKQRKANRRASQRRRDMLKGMTRFNAGEISERLEPREPFDVITKAFIEGRPKVESVVDIGGKEHSMDCDPATLAEFHKAKRGRDIKTFDDLPPDVQQTIDTMSVVDGKIDQTIKANRTAIAIHYQHIFPGRY